MPPSLLYSAEDISINDSIIGLTIRTANGADHLFYARRIFDKDLLSNVIFHRYITDKADQLLFKVKTRFLIAPK